MTRSVGDDGLIPEDPARSEIVDTANNLEIVTMYSFASKKKCEKAGSISDIAKWGLPEIEGCQSRLYRKSTHCCGVPGPHDP